MESLCREVASRLRSLGLNAVSWDSGRGMVGVGIAPSDSPRDGLRFFFGTAGETWAAEILDDDGDVVGQLATGVDSAETDAGMITAGILQAIADFAVRQS